MVNVPDHDGDGDVDPTDHAIEAGCRAQQEYRTDVHTIAFGANADPTELNLTAQCGGGNFYNATIDDLVEVYRDIAAAIIEASFEGQQITVEQGDVNQTLYDDSYIRYNYTRNNTKAFGEIDLPQQSPRFGGSVASPKNGTFTVPQDVEVVEAKVTSYSANFWTDRLLHRNDTGTLDYVYRLWQYGDSYPELGDPFVVDIPTHRLSTGNNTVQVDTATNRTEPKGGSPDDRVLYTVRVDGVTGYGSAFATSKGSTHEVETVNGNVTLAVGNASDPWNPDEDAVDDAVQRLLERLDTDDDGTVDVGLESDDLDINTQNIGGIEWLWGPTTVAVEVWTE